MPTGHCQDLNYYSLELNRRLDWQTYSTNSRPNGLPIFTDLGQNLEKLLEGSKILRLAPSNGGEWHAAQVQRIMKRAA